MKVENASTLSELQPNKQSLKGVGKEKKRKEKDRNINEKTFLGNQ